MKEKLILVAKYQIISYLLANQGMDLEDGAGAGSDVAVYKAGL
jgi:hypothetical protein